MPILLVELTRYLLEGPPLFYSASPLALHGPCKCNFFRVDTFAGDLGKAIGLEETTILSYSTSPLPLEAILRNPAPPRSPKTTRPRCNL
jgi:hypothetical protein